MRILLLGGTGHTGERLARRLLDAGHEVSVFTRGGKTAIVKALRERGALIAAGDITQRWTLWDALEGKEALVSCIHVRHAATCVQACRRLGVQRYIQMSSTRRFTQFPCATSRDVIAGEEAVTSSGLDWTILRATMIFGGRRDANLQRLVEWFRRRRWFPLFGSGANLVQPVFVEDLLDAFMAALQRPVSHSKAYTLAGPEPITMRRMLTETAQACGVARPLLIPIPLQPAIAVASLLPKALAKKGLSAEQLQRMAEDKDVDIRDAVRDLDYTPRPFAVAIQLKASGRCEVS
jgi:uncharacterized protein YbjT (DUF2867 family)